MKKQIKETINKWQIEYDQLKELLAELGEKADSVEYAILATEALKLSEYIRDMQRVLLEDDQ